MFKVGDKVRIKTNIAEKTKNKEVRGALHEYDGFKEIYFNKSMEVHEGKSCRVAGNSKLSSGKEYVKLENIQWAWEEEWLGSFVPDGLEGVTKLI